MPSTLLTPSLHTLHIPPLSLCVLSFQILFLCVYVCVICSFILLSSLPLRFQFTPDPFSPHPLYPSTTPIPFHPLPSFLHNPHSPFIPSPLPLHNPLITYYPHPPPLLHWTPHQRRCIGHMKSQTQYIITEQTNTKGHTHTAGWTHRYTYIHTYIIPLHIPKSCIWKIDLFLFLLFHSRFHSS